MRAPAHALAAHRASIRCCAPTSTGCSRCRGTKQSGDAEIALDKVEEALDARHYGLREAKERIIEYLAVRKLRGGDPHGPILCFVGPAGHRQDVARRSDRDRHRPRVLSHLGRRRARRSRDPRASPHVRRRDAGPADPGAAPRRRARPGLHDRRDRQDVAPAAPAGDPTAAMLEVLDPSQNDDVRRSLPEPAVRPVVGAVHLHREQPVRHPRRRCATAWRSSASRATRSRRRSRSRGATCCRACSTEHGITDKDLQFTDEALRLHRQPLLARGGAAQLRAQPRGRSCASARARKAEGERARG